MADGPMSTSAPGADPWSGDMRSLVLRAWLEPGIPHLRVRVVEIPPSHDERQVAVTTSIEEVCQAVLSWLETLQAQGCNGSGDGAVTGKG